MSLRTRTRAELRDVEQQIRIIDRNIDKALSDHVRAAEKLRRSYVAVVADASKQMRRLRRRQGILKGRLS